MNTRQFSRNSTLAFPKTCDYGCAIERPAPVNKAVRLWLLAGFLAAVAAVLFGETA